MAVRTLTCSLKPTPEQSAELLRLMEAFNAACDYASGIAWEQWEFNSVRLHRLVYYEIRARFGLPAQLAAQSIRKVADAYKRDQKTKRSFDPHGAVTYDSRVFRLLGVSAASMTLLSGREKIKLSLGGYHAKRLKNAVLGETDLCYQKDKSRFRLHFSIKEPDPSIEDPEGFLGVDLGIVNLAVSSDGEVFSSSELKAIRHRHRRLRAKLQAKGTKSAKRLLKKRSKKERRFAKHTNHVVSRRIVGIAKGTNRGIALEDLTGIRDGNRFRRSQRPTFHAWAFHQLQALISYKAQAEGIAVVFVDPRNTSRTCPSCGCIDKRNRPNQATFSCISCEFSGLADRVAAANIGCRAECTRKAAKHLGLSEQ
jgi:IS605 OrfB family transposase